MGEKIRNIGAVKLKNIKYNIELNKPPVAGMNKQIHIQSENIRFEFDKNDFLRFAISLLVAEQNLKNIKGIK